MDNLKILYFITPEDLPTNQSLSCANQLTQ